MCDDEPDWLEVERYALGLYSRLIRIMLLTVSLRNSYVPTYTRFMNEHRPDSMQGPRRRVAPQRPWTDDRTALLYVCMNAHALRARSISLQLRTPAVSRQTRGLHTQAIEVGFAVSVAPARHAMQRAAQAASTFSVPSTLLLPALPTATVAITADA